MDLWGKPITAAGAQSVDGKATYVLLRLAGDIGQIQANQSVNAVRDLVAKDTPPPGLKVYVSGAAPLASDTLYIANSSLNNITIVTIILIVVMLFLVYRSVSTLAVPLYGVLFETAGREGSHFNPGTSRVPRALVIRGEHRRRADPGSGDGLRHLLTGPLSGGPAGRRKQGGRVLHRVSGRHTDHHWLGADDRGGVLLLDFRATQLLPHHGARGSRQHAVYHRGRADARPGPVDVGQPFRALGPERAG